MDLRGKLLTNYELGILPEIDAAVDLFMEGEMSFGDLCEKYGRGSSTALIYSRYKDRFGGPSRAVAMMRQNGLCESR